MNANELPPGWVWTTVGDVLQVIRGASPRPKGDPKYFGGDIPWIMISDISREPGKYLTQTRETVTKAGAERSRLLPIGSLILSNSGTVCVPKILQIEGCIHDGFVTFPSMSDSLSKDFLYWWFHAVRQEVIQGVKQGITQVNLNTDIVREIKLPLAPLAEQRRIVARVEELFAELDAAVEELERVRANLKRYRASVLKAAVSGDLTADWRAAHPNAEPASVLLDRILTDRRAKWEADQLAKFAADQKTPPKNWQAKYAEPSKPDTSNLPPLPHGWCWASVEQLLAEPTCNGISVKGQDNPPGVPALRLSSMSESGFNYSTRRYIPISDTVANELAVRECDFFISRGNGSLHLVGRGTLAQQPPERIVFPDTMIRLRFGSIELARFVATIWGSRFARKQVEKRARTTAGIYKISQKDVDEFVVPLPPLAEQEAIVLEVEARLSDVTAAEAAVNANLTRAARLRQSILKEAFAGRLVPQDPADEPAAVLLERIRAAKNSADTRVVDSGGGADNGRRKRKARKSG